MGEPIRSAAQAAAFLESLVLTEPRPYAERAAQAQRAVTALLGRLGDPQRGLPVIHITGSKGKGSTALILEAILRAAGLRVGTFTSPHLSHWRERFRLAGKPLAEGGFAALIEAVRPAVETLRHGRPDCRPSFFDTATAAALLLFRQAGLDAAIVEVGLGGRLDATNVVEPRVCCLTSIELEHTDKLGTTLAAIAREKAGIIKPGVAVVCGSLPAAAATVVSARARSVGAPLLRLGHEFRLTSRARAGGSELCYREPALSIDGLLPLPGQHQAVNAALAIACAHRFGIASLAQSVPAALARVQLPGRCEILRRDPWIVVDGAHTIESARALRAMLATLPASSRYWLLSFSRGKDPCAIAAELLAAGDHITLTCADGQRSQPVEAVARALSALDPGLQLRCIADPQQALRQLAAELSPRALLCLTGSVYMAGLGRTLLATEQRLTPPRAA